MGRAPCCDKANVKKGPWSPEEDAILKSYINQHGTGSNWIALPQKIGLKRCGKSCRLRWLNYLRPNIKHGGFSEEEDNIICSLFLSIGSRWSIIAGQLPGRTDNDIKNYWNTRLKKKLLGKQCKERASCSLFIKQEMERESENFVVSHEAVAYPILYWPELTIPVAGRFHEDHQEQNTDCANLPYPFAISTCQDQPYDYSISTLASSTSLNSTDKNYSQMPNTFEGFDKYPIQLGEMVYDTGLGDVNTLVYSPMVFNDEDSQKGEGQGCTFEVPRGYDNYNNDPTDGGVYDH